MERGVYLLDTNKQTKLEVPEGEEREREKGAESLTVEIMAVNFLNL